MPITLPETGGTESRIYYIHIQMYKIWVPESLSSSAIGMYNNQMMIINTPTSKTDERLIEHIFSS